MLYGNARTQLPERVVHVVGGAPEEVVDVFDGVAAPFAFLAFQMRKIPVAVVQPIVASTSCAYVSDLRHSHPMTGQRRTP